MKEDNFGVAGRVKYIQKFCSQNLKRREHLEDLGVDGRKC
jgi:hypothetical protein